ncbi:MAG: magnesium protoporphyrin IX methyltransferase, partial [Betaproteobacteria bacterium]
MDDRIHAHDVVEAPVCGVERTQASVVFTFAPRTPLLALMHRVGSLFPRGDRAPM